VSEGGVQKRLSAVLAADVVGYTRLMEKDSDGTVAAWQAARNDVIDPFIAEHLGRIVKHTGDGFLAEFSTVQAAVECAIALQRELAVSSIDFRIGVNLGDIIDDGVDIHGEGVNIAARIESLADPGGIVISGGAYDLIRNRVDHRLEDMGEHVVKHVSAPVRVFRVVMDGIKSAKSETDQPPLPDNPSIAVLPFDNMSGDPEQEYFSDGITEDIITTLSKIPNMLVVARNSTFVYKGKSVDVKLVGAEQGVSHVLEGSVRKAGDRVRITAQLIDASSGNHVWADRYDRKIEDIFELQDEITLKVVTELQVELLEGEMARFRGNGTKNLDAWSHQVRAVACTRVVNRENFAEARRLAERATQLDPEYAAPLCTLAFIHGNEGRSGWSPSREASLSNAQEYSMRALALDSENPEAHGSQGFADMIEGRHDDAIKKLKIALELNPNHADIAAYLAITIAWNGQPEAGINYIEQAMRLSPFYPAWYLGIKGFALRLTGQYEEAISAFRDYGNRQSGFGHIDLAIIYVELNNIDSAIIEAEEILRHRPEFSVKKWAETQMYRTDERLQKDLDALRRAGLPE